MLVAVRPDVPAELGLRLEPEHETEATAEIFNDLIIEKSVHPTAPLLKGEWV